MKHFPLIVAVVLVVVLLVGVMPQFTTRADGPVIVTPTPGKKGSGGMNLGGNSDGSPKYTDNKATITQTDSVRNLKSADIRIQAGGDVEKDLGSYGCGVAYFNSFDETEPDAIYTLDAYAENMQISLYVPKGETGVLIIQRPDGTFNFQDMNLQNRVCLLTAGQKTLNMMVYSASAFFSDYPLVGEYKVWIGFTRPTKVDISLMAGIY